MATRLVHVVVPEGIDDPARPSGGNRYDRRLIDGLAARGWQVRVREVADRLALADLLPGEVVLVDGLVASRHPEVLLRECARLRVVLLLHMPLAGPVVRAAAAVVTTSEWTAGRLPHPARVATPGVDRAPVAAGTRSGRDLLCVGAVTATKGHDLLLEALAKLDDLDWGLVCVGSLQRDPAYVAGLRASPRVSFVGPRTGAGLGASYAAADLLVLPTRTESYGMVITEALARGLPVVATSVGGVPEALGSGAGLLVPPDDAGALAAALRRWLEDAALRASLRAGARARRLTLSGWDLTCRRVAACLDEVVAATEPSAGVAEVAHV